MGLEGPISVRVISSIGRNGPMEEVWTSAFNALLAISLFVESPVIDLLATSTTLTKGTRSYRVISRFALIMMAVCTVGHLLVIWPPLYQLIASDYDPRVRDSLIIPMVVMIPWSAAIGWRRYKQGILIRFGETRVVGIGTFIRMGVMAITGFGLAAFTSHSGVLVAAISLIAAVVAEAVFIHLAAKGAIARHLTQDDETDLSMARLAKFHLPLTVTTMMQLGSNFMITQALAQSFDHESSWPAFQVALALMWLQRAVLYALPEIVITLYSRPGAAKTLWRFAATISMAMSGLMLAMALTGLDKAFFIHVLDKSPAIAAKAHEVFFLSVLIPLIIGAQCYVRGVLTALHTTMPRMLAVFLGLATMYGTMRYGLSHQWSGALIASAGMTLGGFVELVILVAAMRQARDRAAYATH